MASTTTRFLEPKSHLPNNKPSHSVDHDRKDMQERACHRGWYSCVKKSDVKKHARWYKFRVDKNEAPRPFTMMDDTNDTTTNPLLYCYVEEATNIVERERLAVGKDVGASKSRRFLSMAPSLAKVTFLIGLLLYLSVANSFVSVALVSISCESAALRDCICVKQEPSQRHGRWAPCFFRWVRWSKKQSYDSIDLNIFSFE